MFESIQHSERERRLWVALSLAVLLCAAPTSAQVRPIRTSKPIAQPDIAVALLPAAQVAQARTLLDADEACATELDAGTQLALARGCDAALLDGAWHSVPGGLVRALTLDQAATLSTTLTWDGMQPPDGWFVLYRLDAATWRPTPLPEPAAPSDGVARDGEDLCQPVGPPPAEGYEPYPSCLDSQQVLTGMPTYLWRHGCAPTASGMVVGFWTARGCTCLMPGNPMTQDDGVNAVIATGDWENGHYRDFCKPLDSAGSIRADMSERTPNTHTNHCLADFMHTSWSSYGKYYGATTRDYIPGGILAYIDRRNFMNSTTYRFESSLEDWSTPSWSKLVHELDNSRPVVLRVDSDGDGAADHYVAGIGYRDSNGYREYACFDTWSTGIRWARFRAVSSSYAWGITHVIYVRPRPPANIVASDGASVDTVNLTWNAVYGATGYSVWRSTVNDPNTATYLVGRTQNYYYDWSVGHGTRYYYWVKAGFNNAMSELSVGDVGWRR